MGKRSEKALRDLALASTMRVGKKDDDFYLPWTGKRDGEGDKDHFSVRMRKADDAAFVPWMGKRERRGSFVPWTGKRSMRGAAGKRHPPLPLAPKPAPPQSSRGNTVCFNNRRLQWSPRRNGRNCIWWLG